MPWHTLLPLTTFPKMDASSAPGRLGSSWTLLIMATLSPARSCSRRINSDHTLLQKTLTQLGIFVVFAAPGYAVAALTMDRLGRKTIQVLGFGMMVVTFGLLALVPNLQKAAIPFLVIYGFSFFFTEFGPNATTFVYPSEIRERVSKQLKWRSGPEPKKEKDAPLLEPMARAAPGVMLST
jgi:MFS family permease